MAAPTPNTKPPSTAASESCHAPACGGIVMETRKNGIVTALAHSIDLAMLASMKPRRELMSSATARTVQTLARWVAKPRMAASTAVKASASMSHVFVARIAASAGSPFWPSASICSRHHA